MDESSNALSVNELAKTNRLLEQTIKNHKQAFESINDDFLKYQTETDQVVRHLEEKVKAYKAQQKELVDQLNSTKLELQSARQESQQLRSQTSMAQQSALEQSRMLEQTCRQREQEQQAVVRSSYSQTRAASELQYVKMAMNTLQAEFNAQKAELKRYESENAKLEAELSRLKKKQKSDDALRLEEELERMRTLLYRQQVIITALGAPFDPASDEVAAALLEAVTGPAAGSWTNPKAIFSSKTLEEAISETVQRGLYLLGMRQRPENESTQSLKPWRAGRFEGSPDELEFPLETSQKTEFLLQSHENFQGLISRCETLDGRCALLKAEGAARAEEARLLEQKVKVLERENGQLRNALADSLQAQQVREKELQDEMAYWKEAGAQQNRVMADQRMTFLRQVKELQGTVKSHEKTLATVRKLTDSIGGVFGGGEAGGNSAGLSTESLQSQIGLLQSLMEKAVPSVTVLDLSNVLELAAPTPVPPNAMRFLEERLEQLSKRAQAPQQEMDKLATLFAQVLTRQKPVENEAFQAFLAAFHALVQETEVRFDSAAPNPADDSVAKLAREMQAQLKGKQELIDQLQGKLARAAEQQTITLRVSQESGVLLQEFKDVVDMFAQAQKQNRSGRYVSYLEILVGLLLEFCNRGAKTLQSAIRELRDLKDAQANQISVVGEYVQKFSQAARAATQRVEELQHVCAQSTDIARKMQAMGPSLGAYEEAVRQFPLIVAQLQEAVQRVDGAGQSAQKASAVSPVAAVSGGEGKQQIYALLTSLKQQLVEIRTACDEERELHERETQQTVREKEGVRAQLSAVLRATEKRLGNAEADAAGIRKVYTQLSITTAQEKDMLQGEIRALREQNQALRDEHRSIQRNTREELTRAFRERETNFDQQLRLLASDTIVASLAPQ